MSVPAGQSLPEPSDHALKLEFGDGQFNATVICPEKGCKPSYACRQCGRQIDDAETARCYDCPTESAPCWLRSWEPDGIIDECVTGTLTVPITAAWDGEYPVVKIVDPAPVDFEGLLALAVQTARARLAITATTGSVRVAWTTRDGRDCFTAKPSLEAALRVVLAEVETKDA